MEEFIDDLEALVVVIARVIGALSDYD